MKPIKRIFIIHRWGGGPQDDWRPWLKEELEKLGHQVFTPYMPDIGTPVIKKWVNHLAHVVGAPDSNTYFIGHSIGCQTILRYLEMVNHSVGGAIFVSGWFNLENLEDGEVKKIAKPWISNPINLKKVKQVLPRSTLIISDDDPYGAFEENKRNFRELGSKIVILNKAGHITKDDGYTKLQEALNEFEKI